MQDWFWNRLVTNWGVIKQAPEVVFVICVVAFASAYLIFRELLKRAMNLNTIYRETLGISPSETATLKAEVEAINRRLSARHLPDAAKAELGQWLLHYPGQYIAIRYSMVAPDGQDYAKEFEQVFSDAGWKVGALA
jgi:hypothetical protein